MNKRVTIELSANSAKNAIEQLQKVQKSLNAINAEFIRLSVEWLKGKASENIARNYPDFANDFETIVAENLGILRTTEEQMSYIEFGTGIVGKQSPHELAEEQGWQYDVNQHGEKGWVFYHLTDSKLDVKESNIIQRIRADHTGLWEKIRTKGVEPERFMFNAFVDFYVKGEFKEIYKNALRNVLGEKQ